MHLPQELYNPLNIILIALIVYMLALSVSRIIEILYPPKTPIVHDDYRKGYSWMPKEFPECTVWREYTPQELSKFDGVTEPKIYFAICGKVYDVSNGRNFYGPDGPYGNFAGRDASRGLAKQSFDEEMLTPLDQPIDKLDDLTKSEQENLEGWIETMTYKYPVVGAFVQEHTKEE